MKPFHSIFSSLWQPFVVILYLMLASNCGNLLKDTPLYYHGTSEKIILKASTTHLIVQFDSLEPNEAEKLTAQWGTITSQYENSYTLQVKPGQTVKDLVALAQANVHVVSANPMYLTVDNYMMGVTDRICLQFKKDVAATDQQKTIARYGAKEISSPRALGFYTLIAVPKNQSALSVANAIYESGLVHFAHPDFLVAMQPHHLPNDNFFSRQFFLHNTGQLIVDGHTGTIDADIDASEAWDISKGNNSIQIAIIDDAVINHTDFSINSGYIPPYFDQNDLPLSRLNILPGSNFGPGDPNVPNPTFPTVDKHGTACAGIAAGEQDNSEGISGVAPLCRIMPVRIPLGFYGYGVPATTYANAINFAWSNGADVLSNSWGNGSTADIPVITAAIQNAVTQGRGGLGAVVVFSAGNNADHVLNNAGYACYPGNVAVPTVLTVGASDRNDLQANYSPDGNDIDVVAPSHLAYNTQIAGECFEVWTTDVPGPNGYNIYSPCSDIPCGASVSSTCLNPLFTGTNYLNYTARMGGTSAACPQVAGIAALMLSMSPSLTQAQVYDCITKSCDKIGGYTYSNGKSLQTGYGRVNARNVLSAHLWAKDTPDDIGVEPNRTNYPIYLSEDIWVRNNQDAGLVHQNPEYRNPSSLQPNYIYVRVRNAGCADGAANVKLYWAKASPSLAWPLPWDGSLTALPLMGGPVGVQPSGIVPAHGEKILEFPWYPEDPANYSSFGADQNHFCLLARIERSATAPYGMINPETTDLGGNVVNNNNVIWKNITVVDNIAGIMGGGGLIVGNFSKKEDRVRLKFSVPRNENDRNIIRQGQVFVTLSPALLKKWIESGQKGNDIKLDKDQLQITGENAWIGDIMLQPNELYGIHLNFKLNQKPDPSRNPAFHFEVSQYSVLDGREVFRGGEGYVLYGSEFVDNAVKTGL